MAGETPVWTEGYDLVAARAANREAALAEPREAVAEVRDVDAVGVRCRLYRPSGAVEGVVLHLHGGGFVFHDVDVHDAVARRLANRVGMAVLSVDYRRPPEHPFPAAPDDVDTVLRWLDHEAVEHGLTGRRTPTATAPAATLRSSPPCATRVGCERSVLIYPFLDPMAGRRPTHRRRRVRPA